MLEGDTRERRYGDICLCIAVSLCYKAETNKHISVKQLYSNKDVKKKIDILGAQSLAEEEFWCQCTERKN